MGFLKFDFSSEGAKLSSIFLVLSAEVMSDENEASDEASDE